jgi:hypothetical protein
VSFLIRISSFRNVQYATIALLRPDSILHGWYRKKDPYRASIRALHVQRSWLNMFSEELGEGTRKLSVPGRSHTRKGNGLTGTSHSRVDGQGGSKKRDGWRTRFPVKVMVLSQPNYGGTAFSETCYPANISSSRKGTLPFMTW